MIALYGALLATEAPTPGDNARLVRYLIVVEEPGEHDPGAHRRHRR